MQQVWVLETGKDPYQITLFTREGQEPRDESGAKGAPSAPWAVEENLRFKGKATCGRSGEV